MNSHLLDLAADAPDPKACKLKLDRLSSTPSCLEQLIALSDQHLADLVQIIGISETLYHFFCRHPSAMTLIGEPFSAVNMPRAEKMRNIDDLLFFKYQELLKITWMDISRSSDYVEVLYALSLLAETIIRAVHELVLHEQRTQHVLSLAPHLCLLGLGKLGANELNYSSDVDLIFVCSNLGDSEDIALQEQAIAHIRLFNKYLQIQNAEGFLYRVDLNLRPLGKSGPLVLPINETEQYYENSGEPWERFAWLRARSICGSDSLGSDLITRLRPFVFHRALSFDDIQGFLSIKQEMAQIRSVPGTWNVKLGEGGIRDIEFFVQILQLLNGARLPQLQITNTLQVLSELSACKLLGENEVAQIRASYIYLRRLEHRIQMQHEQQTHQLPETDEACLCIAKSLGYKGASKREILEDFYTELAMHKAVAKNYFEQISFMES